MPIFDRVSDLFVNASESYSIGQWLSMLAGLSFVTYVMIIFGGRRL